MDVFTVPQAAALLQVSKSTLDHWRTVRRGPPWVRVGKSVRYRREALDAFLSDNTVITNGNPGR